MIILTKLDGRQFLLNETYIETALETPDTVVVLENGNSYIVRETVGEIIAKTLEFNREARKRPRRSQK